MKIGVKKKHLIPLKISEIAYQLINYYTDSLMKKHICGIGF